MPDPADIPEETAQQTANDVIQRWDKIANGFMKPLVIIYLIAMISVIFITNMHGGYLTTVIFLAIYCAAILSLAVMMRRRFRSYALGLSEQDKAALHIVFAEDNIGRSNTAKKLLTLSGESVPEKEYVRASSQPEQPDTLLRAAQPSADTPQDQLLRPADE